MGHVRFLILGGLLAALSTTAAATSTFFVPVGSPVEGDSWAQRFYLDTGQLDGTFQVGWMSGKIEFNDYQNPAFEDPAIDGFSGPIRLDGGPDVASSWGQSLFTTTTKHQVWEAQGSLFNQVQLYFDLHLAGDISTELEKLTLEAQGWKWNAGKKKWEWKTLASEKFSWDPTTSTWTGKKNEPWEVIGDPVLPPGPPPANDPPTADAGGPYTYAFVQGGTNPPLVLSGAGSSDDGLLDALLYTWYYNGLALGSSSTSPTYSILDPGRLFGTTSGAMTIDLTVYDGQYSASDPATVNYTYTPAEPTGYIPEPLTMAGLVLGVCGLGGYLRKRWLA